jgi:hypothetical protein
VCEQDAESLSKVFGLVTLQHFTDLSGSNIIFEVDVEAIDPEIELFFVKVGIELC